MLDVSKVEAQLQTTLNMLPMYACDTTAPGARAIPSLRMASFNESSALQWI